jgi:hypothetical protein
MELGQYDAILGMPWFAMYQPEIDWLTLCIKSVLNTPRRIERITRVNKEDSTEILEELQLNAMTLQDDRVWMGARTAGNIEGQMTETIKQKFADVLVDKLPPKLPPRRDVEFAIDLVADAR